MNLQILSEIQIPKSKIQNTKSNKQKLRGNNGSDQLYRYIGITTLIIL